MNETSSKELAREQNIYTYDVLQEIAQFLMTRTKIKPKVGIILGTGLGPVADLMTDRTIIPYQDIPHFPLSTTPGHQGELVFGTLGTVPVICMKGRFHFFEGYPAWQCAMPIRVMKLLGVTYLIASNAAGALKEGYKVGDIMLIKDHINLLGMMGNSPLRGVNDERWATKRNVRSLEGRRVVNDERWATNRNVRSSEGRGVVNDERWATNRNVRFGVRFPPMNRAYDKSLLETAKQVAREMSIELDVHEGVYVCVGGPQFETIAEVNLLKILGCMSTVHEVVTAQHCGIRVFAFSIITNLCVIDYKSLEQADHVEVLSSARDQEYVLKKFVSRMVGHIGELIQT
uniref:purine-nucleoside phosphorylase n=1 Tax=Timema shepardi TaxID=629360 RepID=A0A7R9B624_TIMSH|nr:unnamed protein product [Timema shepardi]